MLILGIETSCDDTAAALVEVKGGRFIVRKNVVASQAKLHQKYGGVVPEVAARKHIETIIPVLHEALCAPHPNPLPKGEGISLNSPSLLRRGLGGGTALISPDAIAVTSGPGLITSLLIGVETAKALSLAWDVPIIGTNHIEGHIYSVFLPHPRGESEGGLSGKITRPKLLKPSPTPSLEGRGSIKFPAIALIVSGGHTELILMKNHGDYKLLGRTRDDAAGETFDKAAKMLGLPYPGGPEISKRAEKGNPNKYKLPRPMLDQAGLEFSFSGLKNAIRLLIENIRSTRHPERSEGSRQSRSKCIPRDSSASLQNDVINDLCASVQYTIVDILVTRSVQAAEQHKPKTFILAGGVGANKNLRQTLENNLPKNVKFLMPELQYCQDNAAMIAAAAYHKIKQKKFSKYAKLKANANWELA